MNKTNNRAGGLARARRGDMAVMASKGGRACAKKHGSAHMSKIGQCGAKTFYQRYKFTPAGTSAFAIVRRSDGAVVNFVGSLPGRKRTA